MMSVGDAGGTGLAMELWVRWDRLFEGATESVIGLEANVACGAQSYLSANPCPQGTLHGLVSAIANKTIAQKIWS